MNHNTTVADSTFISKFCKSPNGLTLAKVFSFLSSKNQFYSLNEHDSHHFMNCINSNTMTKTILKGIDSTKNTSINIFVDAYVHAILTTTPFFKQFQSRIIYKMAYYVHTPHMYNSCFSRFLFSKIQPN